MAASRINTWCLLLVLSGTILLSLNTQNAFAHSGRTDSSGGHNCNVGSCAGTYHYHNGGGGYTAPSTPNYYSQGSTNGKAHADREATSITTKSNTAGYQAGYQTGSAGNTKSYYVTAPTYLCEMSFTFPAGTNETYKSAYDTGWDSQCSTIANAAYKSSYDTGYTEGAKVKATSTTKTPSSTSDSGSDDGGLGGWWWIIGIGGFYAVVGAIGWISDNIKK